MSYEYEFVPITSFDPIKKAETIAVYTERGWRVHSVNQDFTMALLEREKSYTPHAVGVKATAEDIRITDSFPIIAGSSRTIAIEYHDYADQRGGYG